MSFLCDQNLGRLARWLRMMGFDAEYMRAWSEEKIAAARAAGRILLTRRRDFAMKEGSIVLESDF
ncbi:MAG TPA: Mut7-C RNAse domain-containing protein, partial [Deltaproteobacteria bacterium]|nr:Mut7-C RNAse domain-containing protein [Deltaproteobacteria bacterium]